MNNFILGKQKRIIPSLCKKYYITKPHIENGITFLVDRENSKIDFMNTIISNGISENYKFIIVSDMSFLTFSRFLSLNNRDHSKTVQVFYDRNTINDMPYGYPLHLYQTIQNPDIVFYVFNKEGSQHNSESIKKILQVYSEHIPIFLNSNYAYDIKKSIVFSKSIPNSKDRTVLSSRYTNSSIPKITTKLGPDEFIDIHLPKIIYSLDYKKIHYSNEYPDGIREITELDF